VGSHTGVSPPRTLLAQFLEYLSRIAHLMEHMHALPGGIPIGIALQVFLQAVEPGEKVGSVLR